MDKRTSKALSFFLVGLSMVTVCLVNLTGWRIETSLVGMYIPYLQAIGYLFLIWLAIDFARNVEKRTFNDFALMKFLRYLWKTLKQRYERRKWRKELRKRLYG